MHARTHTVFTSLSPMMSMITQWVHAYMCTCDDFGMGSSSSLAQCHSPCNVIFIHAILLFVRAECPLFLGHRKTCRHETIFETSAPHNGRRTVTTVANGFPSKCVGIQCTHNQPETIFGGLTRDWRLLSCSCIQRRTTNDNNSRRMAPNVPKYCNLVEAAARHQSQ